MFQKNSRLIVALLMVFSLTACNAKFDLADYKVTAKSEIVNYVTESNYSPDNWIIVCGTVDAGKREVDEAKNKADVDAAVATAKSAINAIATKELFYSLQQAFDSGWLTKEDLQSIAYYHNNDNVPAFPDVLNTETTEIIKRDFVNYADCQDTEHNVQIRYYGTYGSSIAMMIDGCLRYLDVVDSENIAGITFYYGSSQRILIWQENETSEEDEMVKQVKQSYIDIFLKADHPEATIDDVIITKYLGTYNGSFVAVLNDQFNKVFIEEEIKVIIEGFYFTHSYGYPIRVWNNGSIYELAGAYEQGLLTKENLQTISNLYNNRP